VPLRLLPLSLPEITTPIQAPREKAAARNCITNLRDC
jgi:hypothetical protein